MHQRAALLAAASVAALWAGSAAAQPATAESEVEEIVVTGTRVAGRSRLETLAPVDVLGTDQLARQGNGAELAQALANLTPALDFPRPAISDGTDSVRPAVLRGLQPDQTLVLVNGMRGHTSALINVNTSIGRGAAAFDLNTIPTVALSQVEVLRDGAAAQYGSDAIAGVINLRLREARTGGGVTLSYGLYNTTFKTSRGERDASDGLTESVSAWQGLPLGEDGFLTISGEYLLRHPTNRSDFSNPAALPLLAGNVIGRYGDPKLDSYAIYANAGLPLNDVWELYGYGGYQHRDSTSGATARPYTDATRNIIAVYPLGYLPKIKAKIEDYNVQGGVRGELAGFKVDLGTSYGKNEIEYRTVDTINTSLGATSPTNFYSGKLSYDQWLVNLNVSKPFEVGLISPLNTAFGLEYRRESFQIDAGEVNSYIFGPDKTKAPGAQGFPGFKPVNVTDVDRNNWSAYVDLEGKLTEAFGFDVAARYEDYSDFGSKATGKLSARYDFTPEFALRGSVSSGFKAPALQQQYFTYNATNNTLVNGTFQLVEVGTLPVSNPIARALGAKPLEPETAINYSVGAVYRAGAFELTIDAYQIDLENRIVLSENLPNAGTPAATAAAIAAILAPEGLTAARFFINGVDSTTKGIDVVARYKMDLGESRLDLTAAANFNDTEITKTPPLPAVAALPTTTVLFDRQARLTFEQGTPERKIVLSADWTLADFGLNAKITNYDSVLLPQNALGSDQNTGDATLVDLEARYTFPMGVGIALGANNLLDEYPVYTPGSINGATGSIGFPAYSPFGFNGRFLYGRVSYNW
ncbi:MAG: TonB-dependent receptor [Phenylobacterium sp.]|uniref:TonB-dependent receptor plug domain-containing protein n=1 Tax=Phenylobacterium sp. TaxID=1871053 RepID=UPI00273682BE|nr:TonB-dependent receptor [Phenylobacterium sp.]MDP3174823.1 TonB-dependent receptor [Phenylobacterium sp.]